MRRLEELGISPTPWRFSDDGMGECDIRWAKLERDLGRFILKDGNGDPLWLDELSEFRGRMPKEIPNMECGIMCEIQAKGANGEKDNP